LGYIHTFSQFLSATISPAVARVSAPKMIPSLNRQPTMVVPVLVAFGSGIRCSAKNLFLGGYCSGQLNERNCYREHYLSSFEKSKPGGEYTEVLAMEVYTDMGLYASRLDLLGGSITHVVSEPTEPRLVKGFQHGRMDKNSIKYRSVESRPVSEQTRQRVQFRCTGYKGTLGPGNCGRDHRVTSGIQGLGSSR
jgi:hypothetical protein